MSKRELKNYLKDLKKKQLEEQIIELYDTFKEVKEYYNFAFNPNEQKLVEECKFKISNEYFPIKSRKAKMRRSVAQKHIKHFMRLGVDTHIIADIMLYNIEIAQTYSADTYIKQEAFYKSMLKSYNDAIKYISMNCLTNKFNQRINKIALNAADQNWLNHKAFNNAINEII